MKRHAAFGVALALALVGCRDSEPRRTVGQNGLAQQGLHELPTLYPELAAYPLTQATFDTVPSLASAIRLPQTQGVLAYIVKAAFAEGETLELVIDGQSLVLDGYFGLAPGWRTEPCDTACQEWISAYIAASINAYGVHVLVSYRPSQPNIIATGDEERARWTTQEAAFYGNLFLPEPKMFVCRGRGHDPYYMSMRICALEGSPCAIDLVGTCSDYDPVTAAPSRAVACEAQDDALSGAYPRCFDRPANHDGRFPEDARAYERVITLYLKDSHFGGAP